MTKGTRKTNRRLKKTVRKTLGTLFLISAIVVAAIPTEGLRAEEEIETQAASHTHQTTHSATKYKVTIPKDTPEKASLLPSTSTIPTMDTLIPEIPEDATIYTTETNGDGTTYQFSYGYYLGSWCAVILGYNKNTTLTDNVLDIPNTVNAYIQPTGNEGTVNGYVAASKSGEPLYYESIKEIQVDVIDPDTGNVKLDKEGNKVTETSYTGTILPCYTTDNAWKNLELNQFLYKSDGSTYTSSVVPGDVKGKFKEYSGYAQTTSEEHQWIKNQAVKYIGNQYLEATATGNGTYTWKVKGYITKDNPLNGIFAGASNIATLNIGEQLIGVGNYAFYGCNGLNSISFGNGLTVIGNWAFAGCGSMKNINVPAISKLAQIGDHAFYHCNSLTDVNIPISVTYIGDYAFAECRYLYQVEMCNSEIENGTSASLLKEMGWNVFENCETLYSLTFPDSYDETIGISLVKGCKNLHFIASRSAKFTITEGAQDDNVYCFECFKSMLSGDPVNGTFYFEGIDVSALHTLCQESCFAFSYIYHNPQTGAFEKLDRYELTVQDPNVPGADGRSTYVVNSSNELISCNVGVGVSTLDIPDPIGPYHIYNIGANTFANNCNLKLVSLPASVQSVGDGAFKGCHNLAYVIFNNRDVRIGENAFKTQDFTGATHRGTCGGININGKPSVGLTFVGEISPQSQPYAYAMDPTNNYNNGSQTVSYITYTSGWPDNLVVQYNAEKGVSELIDFPAYTKLADYSNATNYPYLTEAQIAAAKDALNNVGDPEKLTEDQQAFIDSALNINIPEGIQAIKDGLFADKESQDISVKKTVSLYGVDNIEENDFQGLKNLTTLNIYGNTATIAKEAFKDCTGLQKVYISGNTQSIGDYAFADCGDTLTDVTLSGTITAMGRIPFKGCTKLSSVKFTDTGNFSCDNGIIYGMSNGAKASIVECLEGRDSMYVKASETAGVTSLAPEAFRYCKKLREIDLTDTAIATVPEFAFADTDSLRTVKLPTSCTTLSTEVFSHSAVDRIEASQYLNMINPNAFKDINKDHSEIVICCPKESWLYEYATQNNFKTDDTPLIEYFTVTFRDWNEKLGKYVEVTEAEQTVRGGEDAVPPTPAGKTGETFQYWDPDYREISGDTQCVAIYSKDDPDAAKLTVTFLDWDDKVVKEIKVASGGSIADSDLPNVATLVRDGYIFTGWDRDLTNITADITTKAVYKALSEDDIVVRYINGVTKEIFYQTTIKKGTVAPSIQTPTVSGYTFKEWLPNISTAITENTDFYAVYVANGSNGGNSGGTTSPGASTSPGSNNGTTAKMYTLTVKNGSGSGSYIAGSQPIIVANDPAANQQFSSWSIDPSNTKIASKVLSATVITMPEANVTVTANYTAKSGSGSKTSTSTGSGNSTNSNSNRRPGSTTTGTVSGGRTTVVIDKNGLSNTGVVSATVNGSSDNFVIKITESAAASEEVVKALMAEYGSDISAIKYFPMDISLYDSTGNTKITDTTGLSISITLPLPDSLITYAGNNKVAGVVNSKLDKLSPKFSTISGVSCVTFTAEHFSPYVIYVDTNNLTAGTIADSTPKTGDGIHPKWFLSMGLACLSIVFFMKKDKKTLKAARV